MADYDFSEGFRRLAEAMDGGSHTIPFYAQMHEFSMRYAGVPADEFYTKPEPFVRAILDTARTLDFDVPNLCWDVYNIEAEALGQKLVLFDDRAPACDNTEPLISDERDLARIKAPDPRGAGRYPFVLESMGLYEELTGDSPTANFSAPLTLACQVMTFEKVIEVAYRNPAFLEKVLDFLTEEVLAPYIQVQLEAFPDAPLADGADALSSLPFFTEEMQDTFSIPYILRLRELCGERVVVQNWWGDSQAKDLERYLARKLEISPGFIKCQDPDLFKVGPERVKAFAEARNVGLFFGIDNNLIQTGPVEDIARRVHRYMEVGGPGGRFVLYLCSLSAQTPLDHVKATIAAIHRFRDGARMHPEAASAGSSSDAAVRPAPAPAPAPPRDVDEILDDVFGGVLEGDEAEVVAAVGSALEDGEDVRRILDEGLIAAMDEIGDLFAAGTVFVPEMLMAARAMKEGLEVLRPLLAGIGGGTKGTVLLGTVKGDLHDIGKNLVAMMLEGSGYRVVDLGVNVGAEKFLSAAAETGPDVIGLSALLTTSMPAMERILTALRRDLPRCPVIVGGAPVSVEFAERIGAQGHADDAPGAVAQVRRLIES